MDEQRRLEVLRELAVLDTEAERRFDRITSLARVLFDVPIALVSLVDSDRQWFKSRLGLDAQETPRHVAFCAHAILRPEPLVVPDATEDPRFSDNPLVLGYPHVRFYAGYPLTVRDRAVGTLCIIDHQPREMTEDELDRLASLAELVGDELERGPASDIDAVTGLLNEWGFARAGVQTLRRAVERGEPVALLRVDIDVEDSGHIGDALTRVAPLFQRCLVRASVVARLQGGSFAVLFEGSACDQADELAAHLEERVAAAADLDATFTSAIASCQPRQASRTSLLHLRDAAEAELASPLLPPLPSEEESGECHLTLVVSRPTLPAATTLSPMMGAPWPPREA